MFQHLLSIFTACLIQGFDKSHFFITSSALLNKTKTQLASSPCQFVRDVCVDEVKNIKEINKLKKSTST